MIDVKVNNSILKRKINKIQKIYRILEDENPEDVEGLLFECKYQFIRCLDILEETENDELIDELYDIFNEFLIYTKSDENENPFSKLKNSEFSIHLEDFNKKLLTI